MADKPVNWTPQQKDAIEARGSDVLVTASAGTGKTAVLSGRCLDLISDRAICPGVQSMLVLTFTDAAAEQMRHRIGEQLRAAYQHRADPYLAHQLVLLQGADISTIHSFCKRLITEYFHELGLDPSFSVIDADEALLLKSEVLDRTVDWAWQQPHLVKGLSGLLYRRDPRPREGFLSHVIDISDWLDTVVGRTEWYRNCEILSASGPLREGLLSQKQGDLLTDRLRGILAQLEHLARSLKSHFADAVSAQPYVESCVQLARELLELAEEKQWPQLAAALADVKKPRFAGRANVPEAVVEIVSDLTEKAFKRLKSLSAWAILNPDYLSRLAGSVSSQSRVLLEMVQRFERLYSQTKLGLNCLDFADLERYALKLLTTEEDRTPSETAISLRRRYAFVFVDEYQDINPVQQAILDTLCTGDNSFVVGDVKQSIYAWRGAQPAIFLQRLAQAGRDQPAAGKALRVDLNTNFRSAKGILDFVNKVFGRIMTTAFGEMNYDDSARLRPGPEQDRRETTASVGEPIVEFHIITEGGSAEEGADENGEDAEMDLPARAAQASCRQRHAAMIARRIRQIMGGDSGKGPLQIHDRQTNVYRDVGYGDIAILMRSLAKKANDYVEVLRLAGIPVSCEATAGYFQATEISDMLSLLKVLDNPQRDIELAAVLRSPIFTLTDTDLVKIRLHGGDCPAGGYYQDVTQYAASGPDPALRAKLRQGLDRLEDWRTAAHRGEPAELIWRIYRHTGMLAWVAALPNGNARQANLLKLHDRAIQFAGFASSAGQPSLARFVAFVEKLQQTGQDWSPAEPAGAAPGAVRILSVHKSKGLEFPIVFLAELDSGFNFQDLRAEVIVDTEDTIGLQTIDPASDCRLPSLAHQVIAENKRLVSLAEEMRILYVAMTRAEQRLILTASCKEAACAKLLTQGHLFGDGPIPAWQLRDRHKAVDWILYALSDQESLHEAFQTGFQTQTTDECLFGLHVYRQGQIDELSKFVEDLKAAKAQKPGVLTAKAQPTPEAIAQLAEVKASLDWQYALGDISALPAKTSVTQLTHTGDEFVRFDYSAALDRKPAAVAESDAAAGSRSSRLMGTAAHLLLSKLDLTHPVTAETIERTAGELIAAGALSSTLAEQLDPASILAFFESDLGQKVVQHPTSIRREWPFTYALQAAEYCALMAQPSVQSQEIIVVQGIIDLIVATGKELLVIDFKTDRVSASAAAQRAETYRGQLGLYARAASAILGVDRVEKWIYFLHPRCAVQV